MIRERGSIPIMGVRRMLPRLGLVAVESAQAESMVVRRFVQVVVVHILAGRVILVERPIPVGRLVRVERRAITQAERVRRGITS